MQTNYNWDLFPNFKPTEFDYKGQGNECISIVLLFILQAVRNKFGKVTISSGWRSKAFNDSLSGSAEDSDHLHGFACDFYVSKCKTLEGKKEVVAFMKLLPGFKYAYYNENGNHPNMGDYIHLSVK